MMGFELVQGNLYQFGCMRLFSVCDCFCKNVQKHDPEANVSSEWTGVSVPSDKCTTNLVDKIIDGSGHRFSILFNNSYVYVYVTGLKFLSL